MKCPSCATPDLVMSERQGIEIDYCPKCRGIWLDRGELDKIIERTQRELGAAGAVGGVAAPAAAPHTPHAPPPPHAPHAPQPVYRSPDDSDIYPAYGHQGKPVYYKKRKHWLLELLD